MPDIPGIFSLSILYGFTICSISCLPTLGVYLMGTGETFRDGLVGGFYFVAGKLLVYGTWGGLAAAFGMMFGVPAIGNRWMGFFIIMAALTIPLAARLPKGCNCTRAQQSRRLPLVLLGATTSLIPCPPLVAVLLLAAHKGSVMTGIGYGLVFGSGLIVSPLIAAGGGMALIAGVIRQKVSWIGPYLQGSAMLILFFIGMKVFLEV